MNTVRHKNLKWGVYTSPQSGDFQFERYVIETQEDLDIFADAFPLIKVIGSVYTSMSNAIVRGSIIIATDEHPASGFPTWCFESVIDTKHPSAMNRVKLG